MLAINAAMVAGLVVVGLAAHSLGVLAAGADYLGDALGTGLSLLALRRAGRRDRTAAPTFAALANASFLLVVTLAVAAGAARRLVVGAPAIHGLPVLLASAVAAVAMIVAALVLGDVQGDISMEAVMLDTLADAGAAIGVAIAGAIILATDGLYFLDPLVALLIALLVAYHALRLLRRALFDVRRGSADGRPSTDRH
ncbi:MAG: cation transporter [Solirubrobacteraceae bacterium]